MEKRFMSFEEVMKFLGVSRPTIYHQIALGMPSYKFGKRRLFDPEELVEWVKSHGSAKPKKSVVEESKKKEPKMKRIIIKRFGHELEILDNDQIFRVGPDYTVEVNKEGKVIDIITPLSKMNRKGLPPVFEKYSYLKDGESAEEIIEE